MDSIHTIDCHYADLTGVACAYLIVEKGRASFIETNTSHALPIFLAKLDELGIPSERVDYIIITHVHLDHAGGASALMKACPNAKLLAHPKAARHMIHPEKLIESSKSVYGEEAFLKLYGQIDPIDESRVKIMLDGESVKWGDREFKFLHTRGHANHHFCIFDSKSNSIFTGDSFGIAYPKMEDGGRFIFPTTTPTDFNAEEAIKSFETIEQTGASHAYLTHFGAIGNLETQVPFLTKGIKLSQAAILEAKEKQNQTGKINPTEMNSFFEDRVKEMIQTLAIDQKVNLSKRDWNLLDLDVKLNAQGLAFAFHRNF